MAVLGFATAVVDVVTYADFRVFAANQTGNVVYLGVRVSGVSVASISSICASFFGFLVAGFISGQLGHIIGVHRRWWLILNSLFQTALIFIILALLATGTILPDDDNEFVLILLQGTCFGCQIAMAKHLSCPEIPTLVVTSPFIDLVSDRKLFKRDNLSRNRRLLYLFLFVLGLIIGGFTYMKVSRELSLAIAGGVKCVVTVSFFFNPKHQSQPVL